MRNVRVRFSGYIAGLVTIGLIWLIRRCSQLGGSPCSARSSQTLRLGEVHNPDARAHAINESGATSPSAVMSSKKEKSMSESQTPKKRRLPRWLRVRLWAGLIVTGGVLAAYGFTLLPPDTSDLSVPNEQIPQISIWVSRPDVQMTVVLDDSRTAYRWPTLYLFADSPEGGMNWMVQSSANDLQEDLNATASTNNIVHTYNKASAYYTYLATLAEGRQTIGSMQAMEGQGAYTGSVVVQLDASMYAEAGSKLRVAFPELTFMKGWGPISPKSPTGRWYTPSGGLVVVAPDEVQLDRTDVVAPAFYATGIWSSSDNLMAYWSGTDIVAEATEQNNLFIAGLVFGIAGSAIIAAVQEFFSGRRERERKKSADVS